MITLRDVHKSFGSKKVLQGINLEIPTGQSLVVIGGSGTGKSVLLKCILGLVVHDQGDIKVSGQRICGRVCGSQHAVFNRSPS